MSNLLFSPAQGIAAAKWTTGLNSYTQVNCSVSLTSSGYRIYRPPNKTVTGDGQNMWGGLKIINSSGTGTHEYNASTDNIFGLVKGHRYRITFHVKGQSSNTFGNYGWTNQMGWGGGGLSPSPSNISSLGIPSNFNGERDCFYDFTVNDDVVKTCSSTYSYATKDKKYLSYNHFMVGFGYTDTGSLGTDIYITQLRMYDLTNGEKFQILKTGIASATGFIERSDNLASIDKGGEALGFQVYEY